MRWNPCGQAESEPDMLSGFNKRLALPSAGEALPGRAAPMQIENRHYVHGHPLRPPFPADCELALFGLGCFWGAERRFWELAGVYTTAAGYAGGYTPNPSYAEVCTGMTGHNEVVRLAFLPAVISYSMLLKVFWEAHNPTQGMRQGNDTGTQYRSGIYYYSEAQKMAAKASRRVYQAALDKAGHLAITTEIIEAPEFYYAETDHQQYLAKNPGGYCGLGGMGVQCPPLAGAD